MKGVSGVTAVPPGFNWAILSSLDVSVFVDVSSLSNGKWKSDEGFSPSFETVSSSSSMLELLASSLRFNSELVLVLDFCLVSCFNLRKALSSRLLRNRNFSSLISCCLLSFFVVLLLPSFEPANIFHPNLGFVAVDVAGSTDLLFLSLKQWKSHFAIDFNHN